MKVSVRRVGLASLARLGCLLGAVAALLPSLACSLLALAAANLTRSWLEGWQEATIALLGQDVARFDLVRLMGLDELLHALRVVTAAPIPVLVLAVLGLALLGGSLVALAAVLLGLAYNWVASVTGGIVVDMAAWSANRDRGRPEA